VQLRDYQLNLKSSIFQAWEAGQRFVLGVLPTGGGKTVTFAHIVKEANCTSIVLAHRGELVSQMSLALAREGVRHRIVGPKDLARLCTKEHIKEFGFSFIDPTSRVAVASVQSVESYNDQEWFKQVGLWVHDEAHHLLRDNQFGRAVLKFPHAKGLGVTATPGRADGRGLGAKSDGFFESMVMGPTCRDLINRKFLSDYKIYGPPSDLKRSEIKIGTNGEFNPRDLKIATGKSTVLGDIVDHYAKYALGKLGLTFSDSIENAGIIASKFRSVGIPAEVLTGKSDANLRSKVIDDFKVRKVLQIVSVALIDEGFDCPAVEVVSDGAATESFGRFAQRFGRGLRILEGKPYMIYLDHVGNTMRHGLPDRARNWSLDRRDKRAKKTNDAIPIRICTACLQAYEAIKKRCPYCDHYEPPALRTGAEFVDGDLTELDAATLAALRGELTRKDGDFHAPNGLDMSAQIVARAHWMHRQDAQRSLRNAIAWWRGVEIGRGETENESYRRFFFKFGIDVANAQLLSKTEAKLLATKVFAELSKIGIDGTVNAEISSQ